MDLGSFAFGSGQIFTKALLVVLSIVLVWVLLKVIDWVNKWFYVDKIDG